MLRDRQIVLPGIARAAGGVILRSLHVRFRSGHLTVICGYSAAASAVEAPDTSLIADIT